MKFRSRPALALVLALLLTACEEIQFSSSPNPLSGEGGEEGSLLGGDNGSGEENSEPGEISEAPPEGEPEASGTETSHCPGVGSSTATYYVKGNLGTLAVELEGSAVVVAVGNRAEATLRMVGAGSLCLVTRGNRPKIQVSVEAAIGHLGISSAGNQGSVQVNRVPESGALASGHVRLRGNQNTVKLTGFSVCPTSDVQGNQNSLQCL